jgi:subtilase family serine protease
MPTVSDLSIAADPSAFNPTAGVGLTIGLSAPSLASIEQNVNNPGSPEYRHYLTYAATVSLGVSAATQVSLVAYLESYGLTVSGNDLSLNVGGTVAQIQSALHTSLGAFEETYSGTAWNPIYDHVTGINTTTNQPIYTSEPRVFYSTTSSVELPSTFAGVVSGISGLNGLIAQPQLSAPVGTAPGVVPSTVSKWAHAPTGSTVSATAPGGAASVNLATGAANYTWNNTYVPGEKIQFYFPSTMPTLYGALPLWTGSDTISGVQDYGQGVTIAVIEVGCVDPSVFESFSNATFGNSQQLMGRLTYIALGSDGTGIGSFSNYDPGTCVEQGQFNGWSIETALDVEYSATMAPEAHIDLFSVPSSYFTAFDAAFQFAAQYLIGQTQCHIPSVGPALSMYPPNTTYAPAYTGVTVYGATTDQYGGSACDASIFSNSWGTGEQYALYTGSSMYLAVENELLEAMAAEGATSLFASGDGGGVYLMLNDFMPADSPAVTSVGGGQITAESGTQEFPNTGVVTLLTQETQSVYSYGYWYNTTSGLNVTVAPVTGTSSFSYWAGEESGTFDGATAGGFGQSMSTPQAWWQNGLDTYSLGARIDPTVSGQAAFNMTIWYQQCSSYSYPPYYSETYCEGPYLFLYGGTSFATPLMAGDLALIEEQLQVRFGQHTLGDANPLFFAAHNAFEAGATSINAFEPMTNTGCAWGAPLPDWCPTNNYAWYYYNLSYQTPMDQGQPPWFATLYNPAIPPGWTPATQYGGSSLWNYLQGLGLPEADLFDKVVVGQTATDHALYAEPFYIEEVGAGGTLGPITTLVSGQTYTFEILTTLAGNLPYSVTAYSGGANNGVYGGGTVSSPSVSSTLAFTYTPTWVDPRGTGYEVNATTYGYFLVSAYTSGYSNYWSFQAFAVAPAPPSVAPQLCVDDIYGICQTSAAEVTQFLAYDQGGWYNLQTPTALVTLNGLPVESAMIVQTSVITDFCNPRNDCTLNPSYYAQGQTIGEYVTDARGTAFAWVNAWTAELNGAVTPQAYTLTAYVNGVASNTVIVWVEPQSGSFFLDDLTLGSNGFITGTVYLNDMTNLEWANISLVPAPHTTLYSDQYVNESFVGVNNVAMTVSLNTKELPAEWPAMVTATAEGWNNLTIVEYYCYDGFCYLYVSPDTQSPIFWQDPTVFLPATVSASATGTVTGTDTISWSGAAFAGASGVLTLVSGAGSTVLATGISGTYALDTTTLLDGSYSVVFTETAPGAATMVRSVSFYADNQVATLQSELNGDAATIASLSTQVARLASENNANASEVATLQAELAALQAQLKSAQATIDSLQAQNGVNASLVQGLQTDVTNLQSEVQTLQNELNAKKNFVAPAWYDTWLGGGLVVLFAAVGVGIGVGGTYAVMRRRKAPAEAPRGSPSPDPPATESKGALDAVTASPSLEDAVFRSRDAFVALPEHGHPEGARELTPKTDTLTRSSGATEPRMEAQSFYR